MMLTAPSPIKSEAECSLEARFAANQRKEEKLRRKEERDAKKRELEQAKTTLKATERFQRGIAANRTTAINLGGGILRIHFKSKLIKKPQPRSVFLYEFK